ncbi:hypothetical protein CCUS01_10350 [Colletotrichum cuscutae]|uniref:Uncharacterized protein n=1 Tax=Colletotrichum cuscutae TaxID=1209917 RepID=A0AAI9UCW7_9PEZI|nr:hypothetical protein CCUS01_10350 [Colletotrichum cuscutae]
MYSVLRPVQQPRGLTLPHDRWLTSVNQLMATRVLSHFLETFLRIRLTAFNRPSQASQSNGRSSQHSANAMPDVPGTDRAAAQRHSLPTSRSLGAPAPWSRASREDVPRYQHSSDILHPLLLIHNQAPPPNPPEHTHPVRISRITLHAITRNGRFTERRARQIYPEDPEA